jgi:hypothetical protein
LVKKALNQAFIDWNYALRQAELLWARLPSGKWNS